jgi:hypothetical protein
MAEIPHLAFPFTRSGTSVAVVEQDTEAHVMACENVIVRCPTGFREERPGFGWPFSTFQSVPLSLGPLQVALEQFEPRGRADATQWIDEAEQATQHIPIQVGVDDDGR